MASPQDHRVIENEVTFLAYYMTSSWIFNFTLNLTKVLGRTYDAYLPSEVSVCIMRTTVTTND
jgi:hypothetical protein